MTKIITKYKNKIIKPEYEIGDTVYYIYEFNSGCSLTGKWIYDYDIKCTVIEGIKIGIYKHGFDIRYSLQSLISVSSKSQIYKTKEAAEKVAAERKKEYLENAKDILERKLGQDTYKKIQKKKMPVIEGVKADLLSKEDIIIALKLHGITDLSTKTK